MQESADLIKEDIEICTMRADSHVEALLLSASNMSPTGSGLAMAQIPSRNQHTTFSHGTNTAQTADPGQKVRRKRTGDIKHALIPRHPNEAIQTKVAHLPHPIRRESNTAGETRRNRLHQRILMTKQPEPAQENLIGGAAAKEALNRLAAVSSEE